MSPLVEIESVLPQLSSEDLRRVETVLRRLRDERRGAGVAELERRNGFEVFAERAGGPVTIDMVRQLCAEEGV